MICMKIEERSPYTPSWEHENVGLRFAPEHCSSRSVDPISLHSSSYLEMKMRIILLYPPFLFLRYPSMPSFLPWAILRRTARWRWLPSAPHSLHFLTLYLLGFARPRRSEARRASGQTEGRTDGRTDPMQTSRKKRRRGHVRVRGRGRGGRGGSIDRA